MPVASKEELNNFWKTLSKSLQQKDTSQLITLCNFPFFVSREIFSNNPLDRVQMYTLDSINLMQYANSIFFEKYFEIAIMECKEPASCLIFNGSFKQKKYVAMSFVTHLIMIKDIVKKDAFLLIIWVIPTS